MFELKPTFTLIVIIGACLTALAQMLMYKHNTSDQPYTLTNPWLWAWITNNLLLACWLSWVYGMFLLMYHARIGIAPTLITLNSI